jgi:hypothetical protein
MNINQAPIHYFEHFIKPLNKFRLCFHLHTANSSDTSTSMSRNTVSGLRPSHSSGGCSLVSHSGGPGSSPGLFLWDLWWTKRHWGRSSPSTSVPLSIFIPPIAPQSPSSIIYLWYNGPVAAVGLSGLSLTPLRIMIIKKYFPDPS